MVDAVNMNAYSDALLHARQSLAPHQKQSRQHRIAPE
jgi:hypothetical protein